MSRVAGRVGGIPAGLAVALLVGLAGLVGCADPVTGQPGPVPPTAAPPSTAGPTGPTGPIVLPPRPRELRLDGVDPCALLTAAQRAELGLDGGQRAGSSDAPVFAGPTCTITGFRPRDIDVGIALAMGSGIEELLGGVRDELSAASVAGFPAVVARPKVPDFCSVDVDLAEGQFIDIQFADAGSEPPIPQDLLCRDALRVAEATVRTLNGG